MSLSGKVAIVTGASRGIGRAVAEQLAGLNAGVAVNYCGSRDKAEKIVEGIVESGGKAIAIRADVGKTDGIRKLFTETLARFGRVDILVNSAGIMENKPLPDVTENDFDRHFALNAKGTYFACQQAMACMRDGGRIVNFSSSVTGLMLPAYSVYAATKGAVEQITRHLAKEFGPRGITINAIAPGPVRTEMFLAGKSEEQVDALSRMNAFGRLGEPVDIAGIIEFLVSEKSRWVTGQTLRANGGYI